MQNLSKSTIRQAFRLQFKRQPIKLDRLTLKTITTEPDILGYARSLPCVNILNKVVFLPNLKIFATDKRSNLSQRFEKLEIRNIYKIGPRKSEEPLFNSSDPIFVES